MRFANLAGRLVLVTPDDLAVDVEAASDGRFGAEPQSAFDDWDALVTWASAADLTAGTAFTSDALGPPVPRPAQVFAIGINYAEHAEEAGYPSESLPVTFTKFASCLTGPVAEVALPTTTVDWEVEMVVVIGRTASRTPRERGWDHVAGVTVGQDLSERTGQLLGAKPQFSLAKSYPGFGPTGPWLVTPDELPDRDDLAISCRLDDQTMQESRTSALVYDVPELVARLSSVCTLLPGDLVFTGTPAGVGNARTPKLFLTPGSTLTSSIEGIGTITQTFTRPDPR
ncbi:fumarylacetoacetate hydrolase family protein [soil metagenome]